MAPSNQQLTRQRVCIEQSHDLQDFWEIDSLLAYIKYKRTVPLIDLYIAVSKNLKKKKKKFNLLISEMFAK